MELQAAPVCIANTNASHVLVSQDLFQERSGALEATEAGNLESSAAIEASSKTTASDLNDRINWLQSAHAASRAARDAERSALQDQRAAAVRLATNKRSSAV